MFMNLLREVDHLMRNDLKKVGGCSNAPVGNLYRVRSVLALVCSLHIRVPGYMKLHLVSGRNAPTADGERNGACYKAICRP